MGVEETPTMLKILETATSATLLSSNSNNLINKTATIWFRHITTSNSRRHIFSSRSAMPDSSNHINKASRDISSNFSSSLSSRCSTRAALVVVVERAVRRCSLAVPCLCMPQEDPKLLTLATILTWATLLTHTTCHCNNRGQHNSLARCSLTNFLTISSSSSSSWIISRPLRASSNILHHSSNSKINIITQRKDNNNNSTTDDREKYTCFWLTMNL